jgi:dienelactone hydrolase
MAIGYVVPERPDWTRARLAPAGDRFAVVRWHDRAANVWVGSASSPMVLASDVRPWRLHDYAWSADGRGLILVLEVADQRHALAWLDLASQTMTQLTAGSLADAQYAGQTAGSRPAVFIAVRHPRASGFQLQSVTSAGAVIREWQAPAGRATRWLATPTQAVVVCGPGGQESAAGGARAPGRPPAFDTGTWWHSQLAAPSWSPVCQIPAADASDSRPIAFSADGQTLFALSSAGRDTVALVAMKAPSWQPEVVKACQRFDVTSALMAPDGSAPDLVTTTSLTRPQRALSAAAEADLTRLAQISDGAPATIIGRNASHCLAEVSYPVGGPAFITYPRSGGEASRPLARFAALAHRRMHCRAPLEFQARDRRQLTGFVTRPAGSPPWPVVLAIHDGPWARDLPQTDPWAQHLASAGYCCVQVNYRGSRGFGKAFRDAGDKQWSLAMQDDLVDALRRSELTEVADEQRIAAIGYGYGGYAALMLATQSELPIAAAAAAAAPADLVSYVSGLLSFGGAPGYAEAASIGDPFRDRDQLVRASPVSRAADIRAPVLLMHGRQDARVPVMHATALAAAIRLAGGRCELVIYEDEGHRFVRPQNLANLRVRTLGFLRTALSEPVGSHRLAE